MGFEDLANGYQSGSIFDNNTSSPFDSLNQMENYGELRENPNNYFNFKAQHLGEIGVIERMVGLVANREDMSFGDISLAETYKDSMLNTRVMGGIYNKTLTDIYKNKDDWLRLQGAMSLGGMIKGENDAEIEHESSLFENKASKDILSAKMKDGAYLEGNTAYQTGSAKKSAENILSGGVSSGYLEGSTVYEREETIADKVNSTVSMSEILDSRKDSVFNKPSPFDVGKTELLVSAGVNGDLGYLEGGTIFSKDTKSSIESIASVSISSLVDKKKGGDIKQSPVFSNSSIYEKKYLEDTTVVKKEVKIEKIEKIFEDEKDYIKKDNFKREDVLDTLAVTKASQQVKYEKARIREDNFDIDINLEKQLEAKSDKKPEKLEFKSLKKS